MDSSPLATPITSKPATEQGSGESCGRNELRAITVPQVLLTDFRKTLTIHVAMNRCPEEPVPAMVLSREALAHSPGHVLSEVEGFAEPWGISTPTSHQAQRGCVELVGNHSLTTTLSWLANPFGVKIASRE